MSARILPLLLLCCLAAARPAQARTLSAEIARISTPVATLQGVQLRLQWDAAADSGTLELEAERVVAADMGYRFDRLSWRCPLQRNSEQGWRCAGEVRAGGGKPLRLSLDLGAATTDAVLSGANATFGVHRNAAAPDITRLDLTAVPVAWAQALVKRVWSDANLTAGTLGGRLDVHTPADRPLRVSGPLHVAGLGLDTPDGSIAAEGVDAQLAIDYRSFPQRSLVSVEGELRGGEMLFGNGYIALPAAPVAVSVAAASQPGGGWQLPQLRWDDGNLSVQGSLGVSPSLQLSDAALQLQARDIAPLRERYLSGWLGLFGLGGLRMDGALSAELLLQQAQLRRVSMRLQDVSLADAQDRFRFDGLNGNPAFSVGAGEDSALRWRGGELHGLAFGAAELPLHSGEGVIGLRQAVAVPALGGALRFEGLNLQPPRAGRGMRFDIGLSLENLDLGRLAQALDWPAFRGNLNGRIPRVRYADERLDLDGVLTAHMFDGTVQVSGLSMERPFGVAPTLSADIVLDDLNLQPLTEVFGFGEITGALDGRISGLRLVDWTAQAFDADLHTDPAWRGKRRISQRAVQDLSSVGGGGGLGSGLQAQALKLFDDFGYRAIGIRCRLAQEVCAMDGLGSAGAGFIIVQGAGIPRLTVVGFNRQVDWPTLVERLVAVTQGESRPVFE
ncbi:hypothetical protein [Pseudoxanthomonas wuyuanensis]|uniref:Dicarboxylate transport n=1 Tax=Pseudoxanthomonas wuyuanensis TaxID=1073196 RepID=A0A286CVG5_9GAMM|nr:hypothetical protein [Pseudoxanthomonas wuyuanensis]KAF1721316.1 hypothetical protein CSC75_07860 [Pseudoxanthomonas wuyuanensis]SOD50410.1 hypothetical protein SAMN06296416_101108 [Pseudoxanthomonas wuyuanensis]